jgi:hypothetical protein
VTRRWGILAGLRLLHDYHRDGICRSFAWAPTGGTEESLSGLRLRCKVVDHELLVLAETDAAGKPVVRIPVTTRLVFTLELLDPSFLAVTNLDEDLLRRQRFHFSNLGGSSAIGATTAASPLPRALPTWDAARRYPPGALVRRGGATYECLRTNTNSAPVAGGSPSWVGKAEAHYASGLDLVAVRPRVARLAIATPARSYRVRVFGLDPSINACTVLLRDATTEPTAEAVPETVVDLTPWPAGRYRIDVDGEVFEAWHDDAPEGKFAFVEIHPGIPVSDPFALLDPAGRLREIRYAIRFANRRGYWKYLTPLNKVDTVLVPTDPLLPSPFAAGSLDPAFPARKDFFVSLDPLPLSESRVATSFDLMVGSDSVRAPHPDPRLGGTIARAFDPVLGVHTDTTFTIRLRL